MINSKQAAIIKKDFKSIVSNKTMLASLIIVPFVFTVFVPFIFILAVHFAPEQLDDIEQVLEMLPESVKTGDTNHTILVFLINFVMPVFFLLIPIMASTIMAASSFVGEKEKRTLETLLYCPLSLTQIYQSKVWASFFLSMAVSFSSFLVFLIVVEVSVYLTTGSLIAPGLTWLFTLLVVSPTVSLLSISLIVVNSAKAKTMEDAQQRAVFFTLPLLLLLFGQFTGVILINAWYLLGAGAVFGAISFAIMKKSMRKFTYEKLLR